MKKSISLELGELAYIADVLDGRHSANFWADASRVALVDKLRAAIAERLKGN
jgi:hypothetical protein